MVEEPMYRATTVGIYGLGAFGRIAAEHLRGHLPVAAYDPAPNAVFVANELGIPMKSPSELAKSDVIVICTPVSEFTKVASLIRPYVRPGTLVLDVGSVKLIPASILKHGLPEYVDVLCTHPLFGPQSSRNGIAGKRIVLCPIRGERAPSVSRFLRTVLQLEVFLSTPEEHDREMAFVQGITHLVAKILSELPLPSLNLTTKSYDKLREATALVQGDSQELFNTIQRSNPFIADVRRKFFSLCNELSDRLEVNDRDCYLSSEARRPIRLLSDILE
jgi:prephenate dehydrogenase